ncbi:MAG TPA: hypothetical protein VG964_00865 [Candidatus Saccharimonadales bacterium]|nr:hypothetical protein [Candidatus Saccharimonadales bacterium]
MGILEAHSLSPSEDKNPALDEDLSSAEAKRLIADKTTLRLMDHGRGRDRIVTELAREGVWVWTEGEDDDVLGLHVKHENGRTYDARVRTDFDSEGSHYLMEFHEGEDGWVVSINPEDELPDELVTVLEDAAQAEEKAVKNARCVRAWTWYHNRTTHPAYVTNMGPGRNTPI